MTETMKNRIAIIAVSIAALSLAVALIVQWLPGRDYITIHPGETLTQPTEASSVSTSTTGTAILRTTPINVNKGTLAELLTLPYMTEDTATAILSYRYHHLSITSWDELLQIDGVTAAMIEVWKTCAVLD